MVTRCFILETEGSRDWPVVAAELQSESQQLHTESAPYSSTHLRKTVLKIWFLFLERTGQHIQTFYVSFQLLQEKKNWTFLLLYRSYRTWLLVLGWNCPQTCCSAYRAASGEQITRYPGSFWAQYQNKYQTIYSKVLRKGCKITISSKKITLTNCNTS